jgi:hypothetical protein
MSQTRGSRVSRSPIDDAVNDRQMFRRVNIPRRSTQTSSHIASANAAHHDNIKDSNHLLPGDSHEQTAKRSGNRNTRHNEHD